MEGQGLADPWRERGSSPGRPRRCSEWARRPGPSTSNSRRQPPYYHRELETRVERLHGLFEPAIIIFMGVVVGFVAVALISAMYGIYNQVKT